MIDAKSALAIGILETPKRVLYNLANSEDWRQWNAAKKCLYCLLMLNQSSGTKINHILENSTCNPLKYTMGSPIIIVSIHMGKSIRIQRVDI